MGLDAVTPREYAVLELVGDQMTHAEIGRKLFISVRTVESHVASLRRKLELPDHRALVRFAVSRRASATAATPALPVLLTSFVGRTAEVAQLSAALRTSRLVSAVGPGGVGKTRLALTVAGELASHYADGLRYVDLVPVSDAPGIEMIVAQACGANPSSRLGPVGALISTLRPQQVLLVLDNCEHHLNAVAVLTERLLIACPNLTVLVTSRARLAVPHERVCRIDGLSRGENGDAVALFVERAAAAGGPVPAETDRPRINIVCQALEGLALAVELAAVRLPSIGLEGLEGGLLDHGGLLTGGARVHQRHRSMAETLDWSVTLLDPAAGRTLRRLSLLANVFDVDAATAVAAFAPLTPDDVRSAVTQLAEHSLLTTSMSQGRLGYRLLEPVRQYGYARMTAADAPAFDQHLRWCLRTVDALLPDPDPGPDAVPRIADNARAALGWALEHDRSNPAAHHLARSFALLLFQVGALPEAQQRMEQAARLAADPRTAADEFRQAAAIAKCRVLGETALSLELAAAESAQAADDSIAAALGFIRAAEVLTRFSGMFVQPRERDAARLLQRAHSLAPQDARVAAAIMVTQANSRVVPLGFEARARAALGVARRVHDVLLESAALDGATIELVRYGDVPAAHRLAGQRVTLLGDASDGPAAGLELKDALHNAVFCALGAGDLIGAQAMALRQHDLQFLREQRDLADEELLAPAALAGDWTTVLNGGERFLRDWTAAGRPPAPGRGLGPAAVALAHGLRGDQEARAKWLDVLADVRGVPRDRPSHGSGFGELFDALVLLHRGESREALDLLRRDPPQGLFPLVFRQWTTALAAEAAVLSQDDRTDEFLEHARTSSAGNPIATAITRRAAALLSADQPALISVANAFEKFGAIYQQRRTRTLAGLHADVN